MYVSVVGEILVLPSCVPAALWEFCRLNVWLRGCLKFALLFFFSTMLLSICLVFVYIHSRNDRFILGVADLVYFLICFLNIISQIPGFVILRR